MRCFAFIVFAGLALPAGNVSAGHAVPAADRPIADACGAARNLDVPDGAATAARPPKTRSQSSSHFVVHYDSESLDDYARAVIDAAELSYRVLVDTLAHLVPPSDEAGGGDARIDIYLRASLELGGAYGTTVPDVAVGVPYAFSYSSWIELSDALDELRLAVVTAHEVYHVVQLGYDRRESLSVLEMFSTWFEDRVYDDANLHYVFMNQFFRRPDRGLFEQHYTNVPWAIFLTERYGDDIMREVLVRCGQTPGPNARGAFDGTLQTLVGRTLQEEFVEFGTWNFFVSLRDDQAHYSEGALYPALRCEVLTSCFPFDHHNNDRSPSELAANYFLLDGNQHRGRMHVRVDPAPLANAYLTVMEFRNAEWDRAVTHYPPGSPPDSFVVDAWEDCDSLLLIYQVERGHPTDNEIRVRARYEAAAPPVEPWLLVLDKDGCRRPFDGVDDEFGVRDGEETPLLQSLRAAGANAVATDSLFGDMSRCGGVFVVGGFGADGVTLSPAELNTLSSYVDAGGDIYLESSRLGAWVDSALAAGDDHLPQFWSRFGCEFIAGEDSANVASWSTETNFGAHSFGYDAGAPDYRVGELALTDAVAMARDDRGRVRATMRRVGASTRIVSTVLLGGSSGRFGSTRDAFVAEVLKQFDGESGDAPVRASPLRLRATSPNPARDTADLFVDAPAASAATVTVYDVAGRRVASFSQSVARGSNTLRIATPRASGVYFVVVEAGGQTARGRFLVLR